MLCNNALLICPSVYPQPSREQLIEHYLNSTQLEAALDTTFMGWDSAIEPCFFLSCDNNIVQQSDLVWKPTNKTFKDAHIRRQCRWWPVQKENIFRKGFFFFKCQPPRDISPQGLTTWEVNQCSPPLFRNCTIQGPFNLWLHMYFIMTLS